MKKCHINQNNNAKRIVNLNKKRAMWAGTVSVLALISASASHAQVLPPECNPNPATNGDVVECVVAAPGVIDGVETSADDLTLNIGSAATATRVAATGAGNYSPAYGENGVEMSGNGNLTLNIVNAGSSIDSAVTDGVRIYHRASSGDVTLTSAGIIEGDRRGVSIDNSGTGGISLNVTDVTGRTRDGVRAVNSRAGSTDILVAATGALTGADFGINTYNAGTGDTSLAIVDATGNSRDGARAVNTSNAHDLSITSTGTVSGVTNGIFASNGGTGATQISSSGSITADYGIKATSSGSSTDLTITSTGPIAAGLRAINANHQGSGTAEINVNSITRGLIGVYARNGASTGSLSINADGSIDVFSIGIDAQNNGNGATTITTAGPIRAYGGIIASNSSSATDLTVTNSSQILTQGIGVSATNNGSGATTINVNDVYGLIYNAFNVISANNVGNSTDIVINSTGTVSGGLSGIVATNNGIGETAITTAEVVQPLFYVPL